MKQGTVTLMRPEVCPIRRTRPRGQGHTCILTVPSPLQYQSRGLVKAPGKSSFTMFVDLGLYQPGGSGDTIPITGEDRRSHLP